VVPTWTLAIAAIVGVAAGLLVGRLSSRPSPNEAAGLLAGPSTSAPAEADQPPATPAEPAAEAKEAESAEVPRIDMEDVVSELERRYQGRRADEEKERARRKAEREPPAAG
jgi:hypothetical protein